MAKTRKKEFRIPKHIAGVKVPKEARRAGEALLEKAATPAGRQALASGLAVAAAAAAAIAARPPRPHASGTEKTDAPDTPGRPGISDPQRAGEAIGKAAEAMLGRLFGTPR